MKSAAMKSAVYWLLLFACLPAAADDALWNQIKAGGHVLLIRHAATDPGAGDPQGFRLDDCRTQRNLSQAGRVQAKRLGAEFNQRRIPIALVRSSRWCRCLETARLAFAEPEPWPALDNTFEMPERRDAQMREVRKALAKPLTGGNLVLITHGVNISALTGTAPAQAEVVIVRADARGSVQFVGRLPPP